MRQRTLRVSVLVVTLLVVGVLAPAVYGLHAWQVRRTAAELLHLAGAEEEAGQWLKAAEYVDRYLLLRPEDSESRSRLALDYGQGAVSQPQKRRAIALCYRALGTGEAGEESTLRAKLAELLLDTGRLVEAEKEARLILDRGDADEAQAMRVLALAVAGQVDDGSLSGKPLQQAGLNQLLERAWQLNRTDVQLALTLATVYRKRTALVMVATPEITEAECHARASACMDELVADNPQNPTLLLARHVYRAEWSLPGAADDLQRALELAPEDPHVLTTAAFSALRRAQQQAAAGAKDVEQDFVQAQQYFSKLLANRSYLPPAEAFFGMGDACTGLHDVDAAIAAWRSGLAQSDAPTTRAHFQSRIAEALLQADRLSEAENALAEAEETIGRLDVSVPRDQRVALAWSHDLRRAVWLAKSNQSQAAVPLLRRVLTRLPSTTTGQQAAVHAWSLLAEIYASLGEWLDAAIAFDQVSNLRPSVAELQLRAAQTWLAAGRAELATERVEKILTQAPSAAAWRLLASAQLREQAGLPPSERSWRRTEDALAALENAQADSSSVAAWQVAMLRLELLRLQAAGGHSAEKASGAPQEQVGETLAKAETQFAAVPDVVAQLVLVYEQLGYSSSADRVLANLRQLNPGAATLSLVTARLAVLRRDFDSAAKTLNEATASAADAERESLQAMAILVALARQDLVHARALLLQVHQRKPNDLATMRRLAELDVERGDVTALSAWENKLLAVGPVGEPYARYYRVLRLLLAAPQGDREPLRRVQSEHAQLAALRPTWPDTHVLSGMIEQRLGRMDLAVAAFQRAVQLGERRVWVFEKLLSLLDRLNRPADCEKYLSLLAAEMPLSQRLTELAGAQQLRMDRPRDAVEIARRGVQQRPADPAARIWLGRLLMISGDRDAAEQQLREAVELAPADVRSWSGLFHFLLRSGKHEQARQTLLRLSQSVRLEVPERSLVLGQGYEMLGELELAATHYEQAAEGSAQALAAQLRLARLYLKLDPSKAEACLRSALEIDPSSAVARRTLAVLLTLQGGDDQRKEADQLLSYASEDRGIAVEDRRLQVMLIAQRGGNANLAKAVRMLEDLVASGASHLPGDHITLAQLSEQLAAITPDAGRAAVLIESARKELLTVAARSEATASHIGALAGFLNRQGQVTEAGSWLERMERALSRAAKPEPAAIAQYLELCLRLGVTDRCDAWLQRLDAIDSGSLQALTLRARCMLKRDRDSDVESIVESRATELLGQANDTQEKLRVLRGLGEIYVGVEKFAAAEKWYRQLLSEDPKQFAPVAQVCAKQGRMPEAVEICLAASHHAETAQPAVVLASILSDNLAQVADFQRAEPMFRAMLDRFPQDGELLYALAIVRIVERRFGNAIPLLRKVISLNPRHVAALNNLALLLAENPAARPEALGLVDQAIAIAGSEPGLLDTKGAILVYDGQAEQAVTLLEAAARGEAADSRHNLHLALAYHELGDVEKARLQLERALARDLESQLLTPVDRRLLAELQSALEAVGP